MADEDESEEPSVELGEPATVEGAPLGRVASRLSWPRSGGAVLEQEGDTTIRTSDGPRPLSDVVEEVETPYFATRQEFITAVREVIGYGPVPTSE